MLSSFFVMVIMAVLTVVVKQMSKDYEWMLSWVTPVWIMLIIAIAVFLVFVIINVIRLIKR